MLDKTRLQVILAFRWLTVVEDAEPVDSQLMTWESKNLHLKEGPSSIRIAK